MNLNYKLTTLSGLLEKLMMAFLTDQKWKCSSDFESIYFLFCLCWNENIHVFIQKNFVLIYNYTFGEAYLLDYLESYHGLCAKFESSQDNDKLNIYYRGGYLKESYCFEKNRENMFLRNILTKSVSIGDNKISTLRQMFFFEKKNITLHCVFFLVLSLERLGVKCIWQDNFISDRMFCIHYV